MAATQRDVRRLGDSVLVKVRDQPASQAHVLRLVAGRMVGAEVELTNVASHQILIQRKYTEYSACMICHQGSFWGVDGMRRIRSTAAALLTLVAVSGAEAADEFGYKVLTKKAAFEDVLDNVKEAIINRGYVIDYVGHFNDMLERTAEATGSVTEAGRKSPYKNAQYLQFCPAKITHEAVSASLFSIANCPIAIFVFEAAYDPGKISVGFRLPVASPSKRVKDVNARLTTLLTGIAADATK